MENFVSKQIYTKIPFCYLQQNNNIRLNISQKILRNKVKVALESKVQRQPFTTAIGLKNDCELNSSSSRKNRALFNFSSL